MAACMIALLLYLKFTKSKVLLLMTFPLIISYFDNQTENFVTTTTYQQVSKINNLKYDNDSRTDIFKESFKYRKSGKR